MATSDDSHEKIVWRAEKTLIGVDEVGRGCLAGPLVAGAVELPVWASRCAKMPRLFDSKRMTERQRLVAYQWIIERCSCGLGIIHPRSIDKFNIWRATILAMKRAVFSLLSTRNSAAGPVPHAILVDAMPVDLVGSSYVDMEIKAFPRAEEASLSVAAASIFAKVSRDRLMADLAGCFPSYSLASHKGYATRQHLSALSFHGHSLIHRLSFLRRKSMQESGDSEGQGSIC